MCKRNTTDPLVRAFLDTYHLNLLAIPRADAAPGDLYVETDRGLAAPGRLASVLKGKSELPPVHSEPLADLRAKVSRAFDLKVGLGLLEGFLAALGAGGVVDKLETSYSRANARTVRFRFRSALRDSIDPLELGARLADATIDSSNALVRAAKRYLVTTAVVRTPSLSILAEDDRAQAMNVDVGVLQSSAEGKASIAREAAGEITYSGATPLAIGVELLELATDEHGKLMLVVPANAVRVRAPSGAAPAPAPAFLGDADAGDVFVQLPQRGTGTG